MGVLLLAGAFYFGFYRKKKVDEESFLRGELDGDQVEHGLGNACGLFIFATFACVCTHFAFSI